MQETVDLANLRVYVCSCWHFVVSGRLQRACYHSHHPVAAALRLQLQDGANAKLPVQGRQRRQDAALHAAVSLTIHSLHATPSHQNTPSP